MKKYVMEFIGTFFLVLVIGLTVIGQGAGAMAPLAIGATLMVMVYVGGHISGAHYNPAVTIGVWLRGKCDASDVPGYIIAQLLAGGLAALLVNKLKAGAIVMAADINTTNAFIVELLFTFALVTVVLNVATVAKTAGNSYFGLAIGFTVTAAAYAAGNISGGAFNPAVAVGITVMGLSKVASLGMFFVAHILAGVLAAVVFKFVNEDE
jgi:aquaporin Z